MKDASDMGGKKAGEVRVEATDVANGKASHLCIVVKDKDGKETGFRGGPELGGGTLSPSTVAEVPNEGRNFGRIVTTTAEYRKGFVDYDTNAQKVVVGTGNQSVEQVTECFQKVMNRIDQMNIPYNPLGPNSNSVVGTLLEECGCEKLKPVWITPGFATNLTKQEGKKTTDK